MPSQKLSRRVIACSACLAQSTQPAGQSSHRLRSLPQGWVVAQRGLREARLRSRTRLHLLTTWEALTQLRSLELVAPCIVLAPGAALPPSLTALTLGGDRGPHMPHQVRLPCCCSWCPDAQSRGTHAWLA